jgi:hypothetical protein
VSQELLTLAQAAEVLQVKYERAADLARQGVFAFVNLIWPLLILSFGPTWPLWRLPVQTPLFDPLP